jgi:hypothetical protein
MIGGRKMKRRPRSGAGGTFCSSTTTTTNSATATDNKTSPPCGGAVNPYQMLQVRKDATKAEIREAYRRLALWHHPRRTQAALSVEEKKRRRRMFTVLAACCETLLERDSRARCDALLKEQLHRSLPAPLITTGSMGSDAQQQKPTKHPLPSCSELPLPFLCRTFSSSTDGEEEEEGTGWTVWPCACTGMEPPLPKFHNNSRTVPSHVLRSCSTEEIDQLHYTHAETNRLFGGPLSLLYQARSFKTFSDPYNFFERVFGSSAFPTDNDSSSSDDSKNAVLPVTASSSRSSAWTGSSEILPNGTTVYTTSRIVGGRKLTKKEAITVDPITGQKRSCITVTGEDIQDDEANPSSDNEEDYYWICCSPCWLFPMLAEFRDNHPKTHRGRITNHETRDSHWEETVSSKSIFRRMSCVVW